MGEDCKGVAISDWPERHRDSAAYIIFTSGSTGSPRGVCVERRQLLQYVQAISKTMEASPGASYATVTTIAADLGNTMIFPALCTGGCLHIVSSECALSPSSLGEYFSRHEIDFLKIVPSHLETLLKGASATSVLPRKRLILGGESCGWNLVSKVRELAPECMILNHYGPTETTVGVLTHELSDVSIREEHAIVPIGRPLNNIQAYVLDRHLQPVPVGVRGELYIGGDSVTRGYYNLPAITAEKFIPDPFSEVPGSRLYRTGDLARYHVNGIIEFQGRKDQQIKIRGFRIELGEIEEALKRHPSVQQVVVLPVDKANTGKHLVAYIVCHEKSELRPQDLRQFAKQELPEYMVPPAISILANLPLTPNGKIDQKALMEIAPEPCTREAIVEASTPMEKALVAVWKRLLGVEAIGVNDDFFELGGHSLMATQMTSRLEEILPADAPLLVLFFETPTVAGLAEAMQRATSEIGEIERAAETIEEMALSWEL
jgi:amino acid adenylation domain-containing protein